MTKENVYAAILAGGSGTRMGNANKPKQFFLLNETPIIIHTIEKFCTSGLFEKVLVLCPEAWLQQTSDLIKKHCPENLDAVDLVAGGAERSDTVMNAVSHIEQTYGVDENTVIVTHDAVRPFVSYRILEENIAAAKEFGACDTVIPASDTIVESVDGNLISDIPPRGNFYQGQTPQSFQLLKLKDLQSSLSAEEKAALTDACKVFILRGEKVALVEGDVSNMKITYPQDMLVAEALVGE